MIGPIPPAVIECVPRATEAHATLSTAMYHWGRAARLVGSLRVDSKTGEWMLARGAVDIARACMELALNDPRPEFIPKTASKLSGEAYDAYMQKHFSYLRQFAGELGQLSQIFCELNLRSVNEADVERLRAIERNLMRLANDAHSSL